MANLNKTLSDLAEFYDNQVNEVDKYGFSDYYKLSFSLFRDYVEKNDSFHIIRYEYLDGYFIFGTGTNSVVHFHINECPGWKFGIWFSGSTEKDNDSNKETIVISGEFFAQYEETIDKFKPTASVYSEDFKVIFNNNLDQSEICSTWKIEQIIKFISKFPIHAWAADNYYYDYNTEYVPSIILVFKYLKYKLQTFLKNSITPILDKNMLAYTKKLLYPTIESNIRDEGWQLEIIDHEDFSIPRYEIAIKVPKESNQETGYFAMFEDTEDGKLLQKKFKRREAFLEKISYICGFYWFKPIHSSIIFWKEEK